MNNIPSRPAAEDNDFVAAIKLAIRKALMQANGMLPVKVLAYDRSKNRVRVEHMIQITNTDGSFTDRGIIASVPVLRLGDSAYVVSFPIPVGSLGWIKANDRDISLFLRGLTKSPPNTYSIHDFNAGIFIPDAMGASVPGEGLFIQAIDGSITIQLNNGEVSITTKSSVNIDTSTLNINADVNINGNFAASGGEFTHEGVNVGSDHMHKAGEKLIGNAGKPVTGITGEPQ